MATGKDHPANRAAEPRGWDNTVDGPARSESPVDRW